MSETFSSEGNSESSSISLFQCIYILLKTLETYSKDKKIPQYGRERYKNLPEGRKQRLVEYKQNITKYEKIKLPQIMSN